VTKIANLVLADVDVRFESTKQELKCEGTGIQRVEYENRTATFFIDSLDRKIEGFLQSGVADLFEELFQDVVAMKLDNETEWYEIETTDFGPIEAGARIVAKMLDLEYVSLPDIMGQLSAAEMSALKDKSIDIDLKIVPGIREYIGSYQVKFIGVQFEVTLAGTTEGVTGAGTYEIGSEVTITVTAPQDKEVDTFNVNGTDKKDELINGEYKFIITEDTTVKVTYAVPIIPTSIFISGPETIEIKLSGDTTETYTATVKDQKDKLISGAIVTWSLKEAIDGVNVDAATGEVTVADTSMATGFTIVATSSTHPEVYEEKVVALTKEKNTDATLSDLTVEGVTVADFDKNIFEYHVELPAGTTEIPTVAATATDSNATFEITQATALDAPYNIATIKVTAEDGTTAQIYSITFTVKANEDQDAPPAGLDGVAPTSKDDNDGKIIGVSDTMEYKLATDTEWISVSEDATEITGLAAGTYQVRYAAKTGYNPSEPTEVVVPAYVAPKYIVTFSVTGDNGTLTAEVDGVVITPGAQVEEGKAVVFTAAPATGYQVKEWILGGQAIAGETGVVYTLENLQSAATVTVKFKVATYTVTFQDWDGSAIDTQQVEHGGSASAPADPEREGYTFNGWDEEFTNVTSDLTIIATYTSSSVGELNDLILDATARTRPDYTTDINEWDIYWNDLQSKLAAAEDVYNDLKGKDVLTPEEETQLAGAKAGLQTAMEIIDGIEDFDAAFGQRTEPRKALEKYINDESRKGTATSTNKPHRLRAYYDKDSSDFYWLMSRFQQSQQFYAGTAGTGMNPGLKELIETETLIRITSGDYVLEIFDSEGNRRPEEDLDEDIIPMALEWVDGRWGETYSYLAGKSESFNLVGRTNDGTEYQRSYTFHFVDSGLYLFDPYFEYYVDGGAVLRDFGDFTIINATKGIGYMDNTIQAAIDAASPGDRIYVGAGTYNENVSINKSITLIGDPSDGCMPDYVEDNVVCERLLGTSADAPVLDGSGIGGATGIQIASGVSNVTLMGFEIKNFDSGIVAQGNSMNNLRIDGNYIHDVSNGITGGTTGAQTLSGWSVNKNIIDNVSNSGISLANIGSLEVDKNRITAAGTALEVKASGNHTVENVETKDNEITGAVNVLAQSAINQGATLKTVTIKGNKITGTTNIETLTNGFATVEYVTMRDNEIYFTDKGINITANAPSDSGSATVANITLNGNELEGSSVGIHTFKQGSGYSELKNLTITGNKLAINNPTASAYAVGLADVEGYSEFGNNEITLSGTLSGAYDGVDISGGATENWTISGNELYGNDVGTTSSGFRLRNSLASAAELNLTRNRITGWVRGVYADALASGTTVQLRTNWIYDNSAYGIENGNGATVDAILNYWGETSGPYHSTNTNGTGNKVSGNVDFNPWHQDADFISISEGTVLNINQEKYYKTIQAAVNEANPGDTIQVGAGTYYESVTINKSITLTGDCGDLDLPGPGPNAPILDGTGQEDHKHGFYIIGENASNVTIEGFEIRNFSGSEASGIFGNRLGVNDVTIKYNHIHDVRAHGVRVFNGYAAESMTGWAVTYNVIEKFGGGGGSGIYFVGVSGSQISNNKILNPTVNCPAILLKAEVTGDVHLIMSDITISNNEIIDYPDRAIYVLANANYHYTHATIKDVNIAGNTITGDAQAITFWAYGDGTNELKDMNITDNNITVNYPDSEGIEAVYLDNVRGSSNFIGNTINVVGDGGGYCEGIVICGGDTESWTLDDNYIDGHNKKSSYGVCYFWIPAEAPLNMNRNTITGWDLGIRGYEGTAQATLRSNLIYGNNTGTEVDGPNIDATLNFWGHESGPFHSTNQEGSGNAVTDAVLFAPWYTDEECTTTSDGSDPLAMGLMQAMLETVTVTFNGNGGTPATTEVEVEGEATLETLPTITRDGYTFAGWNTLQDGTGEVFTIETVVTADMTVYAIWEEAVVGMPTIVSIADVTDVEVDYGTIEDDAIPALAATTTIEDSDGVTHTVDLSWTIADYDGNIAGDYTATGTFVLPEGVYQADPALRLEVTATVTVKAEAVAETFIVTYDGNGGTPTITEVEVEGEATVGTLPTVTRDGYTFVEWNTQPNGEGNVFTAETVIEADITVYAVWEEDEVADTFTVNVTAENGTVAGEGSYEEGTEVTLKAIPAEGYVFVNWTDGEDEVSTENSYTFIMSAEAVELLANFEEESEEIDVGMDTAPIDISIQAAENAKSDVVVSEDGQDVSAGTYWVTQGDMDALDEAIAVAEAAKDTAETQQDVAEAVEALEAVVSTFNDAKQEAIDEEEENMEDTDNNLEGEVETADEEEVA
jgi:uncharacterized repeat protein (TIGR02543 family)